MNDERFRNFRTADGHRHVLDIYFFHYDAAVFPELELFVAAVEVAEGVFAKVAGMGFS